MSRTLLPGFALLAASLPAQEERLVDPAPPTVVELQAIDPPAPESYPELQRFNRPRALSEFAETEDWPGFMGPRRDNKSAETRLRRDWGEDGPPLLWTMTRGQGYAAPAIVGERLVFTHRSPSAVHIDCLHPETGERYWRFSYPTDYRGPYISDSGPRATPLIQGDRVWVHGVEGMLHCLELSTGRVVWKRNTQEEFDVPDLFFGVVSSPLLWQDKLLINVGGEKGPTVAAFDPGTGRMLWGAGSDWSASCASPIVTTLGDSERLFVIGAGPSRPPRGGLMVLDPTDGRVDFTYKFRSRTFESVTGATPIVAGGGVFLTASYSTGSVFLLGGDGPGEFEEVWKKRRWGSEFATPIEHDGHLYLVDGVRERSGALVTLELNTGEETSRTPFDWQERVPYRGQEIDQDFSLGTASLLAADGSFWCLGELGHVLRLDCTPEGATQVGRFAPFRAAESWTPLVIHRGLLFVCQNRRERFGNAPARLLCYDLRAE